MKFVKLILTLTAVLCFATQNNLFAQENPVQQKHPNAHVNSVGSWGGANNSGGSNNPAVKTETISITFKNSVKSFRPNYVITSNNGLNETVRGKLGPVRKNKDNSFTQSFTINEGQAIQVAIKTSDAIQSNVKTLKTVKLNKNTKITTSGKKKDIQVTIE